MEIQERSHRHMQLQDQENRYAAKKINLIIPTKRQGLTVRGVLGDLNSNIEIKRDVGKVAGVAAEFEKKSLNRGPLRSNYNHVQSKVDTGLVTKPVQPASRPPLRREESTRCLAARAAARALKDAQAKSIDAKKSAKVLLQTKDTKKFNEVPALKETKEKRSSTLKEPTESLGKLKLVESKEIQLELDLTVTSLPPTLPANIEDIDEGNDSPFLLSIYIKDIYKYLTNLEVLYPIEPNHLRKQAVITGRMRATLIDWLVEVQKQFSLTLETFHLTVGIIDRYLQMVSNVQRNQLQLVGVTAMFIASKYEEIYSPDIDDFIFVTDKAYTKSELLQCEREMLSKLGFCLARPIPLSFLRRFVKVSHGTSKNHHLAKYFIDLCLVEYSMSHYRPSELAAAAVCFSLYLLSSKTLRVVWTPTLAYYSGYTLQHLTPIIKKMAKIVVNVENSRHTAVYNKYLDVSLAKVSSLPQLKGEAIMELVNME